MAEAAGSGAVVEALLRELTAQGQGASVPGGHRDLRAYPIAGSIDVLALAAAVESALGGDTSDEEEAKTPAELNAANDG